MDRKSARDAVLILDSGRISASSNMAASFSIAHFRYTPNRPLFPPRPLIDFKRERAYDFFVKGEGPYRSIKSFGRKPPRKRIPAPAILAVLGCLSASCDFFKDVLPENISEIEQRVFEQINAKRTDQGLDALVWKDVIADQARGHSKDMAEDVVPFGHDGFDERFAAISQVIPASAGAENIAYAPTVSLAIQAWMVSAEHKTQILGNYDYTGVGVAWDASGAQYYFTQIFIRSR